MLGGDCGDSGGGGEGSHSKLKTVPYIHDDTLPRANGRASATNHTPWSDSLRHGDASCLWSHIHWGGLFLPVLHTYKHTRTHARAGAQEGAVVKRPDGCAPAAEVVCAVWPLTDVGAAFRKHCSLTECRPSIKQITKPSSSPQPSHVCLPTPNSTPKRVRTHNGSWTSVQKLGHLHQSC